MLKMSALKLFKAKRPIYIINSVDNTKLPLYSPTDTAPHFLQKLTPFIHQSQLCWFYALLISFFNCIPTGLISSNFYGPYSVSKYGVEAFSDALRREMLPWGIKVCILEPGSFLTNICAPDMFERQLREGQNKLTDELKDEYGEEYLDRSMNIYTFHTFISYILTENQRRKLC